MFFYVLQLLPRERKKHEYLEAVKNRYKHLPEVKRIVRYVKVIMLEVDDLIDWLIMKRKKKVIKDYEFLFLTMHHLAYSHILK